MTLCACVCGMHVACMWYACVFTRGVCTWCGFVYVAYLDCVELNLFSSRSRSYLSLFLSIHLSIYQLIFLPSFPSIYLPYLSVYRIYLPYLSTVSIYLSIYLSSTRARFTSHATSTGLSAGCLQSAGLRVNPTQHALDWSGIQ